MPSHFDHLRGVKNGDKTATVAVSLANYTPPKRGSDVPDGLYAGPVVDALYQPAASGNGVNLRYTVRTQTPEEFAGAEVSEVLYFPFDGEFAALTDEQVDALADTYDKNHPDANPQAKLAVTVRSARQQSQHLLASLASWSGKYEELKATGKPAGLRPDKIIGKMISIETEHGPSDYRNKAGRKIDLSGVSQVRWPVLREAFEKQPGPFKAESGAAQRASQQTSEPDLGAGTPASKAAGNGTRQQPAPAAGQASAEEFVTTDF